MVIFHGRRHVKYRTEMLYLIGLGLGDAKDISVKGLEVVRKAERVYLEAYTSILSEGKEALEQFYGRSLIVADRELLEQGTHEILKNAVDVDVAVLVVGDPFGATTHTDLILRAKESNIPFKIVHNASILNAIGCCGLQLYNFGETVSIPIWTDSWQPDSFYEKIISNKSRGLHTLCLLDIKVKEPTLESLTKKKKQYMPPQFMTVNEAASQLLQIISKQSAHPSDQVVSEDTFTVGVARVGSESQKIVVCPLKEMKEVDLGAPLHSLVICGQLHPVEVEYLQQFATNSECLTALQT